MQRGSHVSDFIGPYRVIRHLSVTGSVQTHLAREEGRGGFPRDVILKMVPKVSGEGARDIEELIREVTACAKLTHPGIVRIRHFFEHDDALVLVLEYVDGIPLAELLAKQRGAGERLLSDDAVFHVGVSLCDALAHAHGLDDDAGARAPIVHRAVNPSNVLLARDGSVKLDGFGFANILGGVATDTTGSFKWTPAYMAPEQVTDRPALPAIDVYACGLILWELLAGRPSTILPQDPLAIEATLRAVADRNPPSLATVRPDLPAALVLAIDAALASAPEKRTVSCAQIAQWARKVGRLEAGKREVRELVIRAQASVPAPSATKSTQHGPTLPALPPRPPVPPPEALAPVKSARDKTGAPRLPPVVMPPIPGPRTCDGAEPSPLSIGIEPSPVSANTSMSLPGRSSWASRLSAPTTWRRHPTLVAWVGLTLGLAGLIVGVAFRSTSAPSVEAVRASPKAASAEPEPAPGETGPDPSLSASALSASPSSAGEDFSEDLKQRGLGYLTVHSAAPRANVYVNLKPRGKIGEKLTVPCGSKFVSIGLPGPSADPLWLAPGKTMLIPCGGPLETTMDPRALRAR